MSVPRAHRAEVPIIRTCRLKHSLLILATVLVQSLPVMAQDEGPLGAFRDPTSVRILVDATVKRVGFGVRLRGGVTPTAIQVSLDTITLDGLQDTSIRELFSAAWDSAAPAVIVTVALKPVLRPGSYQLYVRLRGLVNKQRQEQTKTVTIIVPPATIRSLGSLLIHQEKWYWGDPIVTGAELRLQETSRLSRVSELGIVAMNAPPSSSEIVKGSLVFDKLPDEIAPGKIVTIKGRVSGTLPLGSTKGKLELTASQLAQPYEVAYEVVTGWTKVLLLACIGLGIGVGYVIKTRVTIATEVNQAILEATEVLSQLERPRYPDATLKGALIQPLARLREAVGEKDPKTISDRTKEASEALTKALEELRTRRAKVQEDLKSLVQITSKRWNLPEQMNAEVERLRNACDDLQAKLEEGAVDAVEHELKEKRNATHSSVLALLNGWRLQMVDGLTVLPVSAPPLLPIYGKERQAEGNACLAALKDIPDAKMKDDLECLLQSVTNLSNRLYRFLEAVVLDLRAVVQQVASVLGAHDGLHSAQLEVEELGRGRGSWKPEVLLHALNEHSARLHDALRQAVLDSAPHDHDRLGEFLSRGRYVDAAEAAVATPSAPPSPIAEAAAPIAAPREAESPRGLRGQPLEAPAEYPAGQTTVIIREISPIVVPPSAANVRREARAALLHAKRWNTATAAVLAVAFGYLVFQESFVGSWENISAAFIWALGVDASVDVVLETAKKKLGAKQ